MTTFSYKYEGCILDQFILIVVFLDLVLQGTLTKMLKY